MPITDRPLVSSFFLFYRSFSVQPPPRGVSAVSFITPKNFTNFRPQASKEAFAKGCYDICFARGKTGHRRANCPNLYFTAGSTYKQTQSLPSKDSGFSSSSSIAANKEVKETLEGISDDGPAFEECFEFENSPNSIQSVKGRLKAHFSFWVHALVANDFILRVIDKGYAIPFIIFPQNVFFDNNHSALMHADFVFETIHELILSGSVVQVSSHPHVVNPLSVSIQSFGKKWLILDLRHVNKHIWKEKFKFEDSRNPYVYLPFDHFMFKFDLKSGYHYIVFLQEHQTFLGFSWLVNGVR